MYIAVVKYHRCLQFFNKSVIVGTGVKTGLGNHKNWCGLSHQHSGLPPPIDFSVVGPRICF